MQWLLGGASDANKDTSSACSAASKGDDWELVGEVKSDNGEEVQALREEVQRLRRELNEARRAQHEAVEVAATSQSQLAVAKTHLRQVVAEHAAQARTIRTLQHDLRVARAAPAALLLPQARPKPAVCNKPATTAARKPNHAKLVARRKKTRGGPVASVARGSHRSARACKRKC